MREMWGETELKMTKKGNDEGTEKSNYELLNSK